MTLYLIAHKVRGERALDVAEPMEMADGRWWIIPTSGHRAYPYWCAPLESALLDFDGNSYDIYEIPDPPTELRDHYQTPEPTRSVRPQTPAPRPEDL